MVLEITVQTPEDIESIMSSGNYEIARSIVENILINLSTKKKHVHVISIYCEEDGEIYDLTVERKHFADTLRENLSIFEQNEDYEGCIKITNAIEQLSKP